MKKLVIVPAYNEESVILSTLVSLKKTLKAIGKFDILVIDDGSNDNTYHQAKKGKVKVIRHSLNRGLGGALGTGIAYAKRNNYNLVVTFDADGQHVPADIKKVITPIQKDKADIVIGVRSSSNEYKIPLDRKIIIFISNLVTLVLFRVWSPDSQSGFRAFSKKALSLLEIKTERMEVSSEIFSEIGRHNLRLTHAPIKVIYTQYSRSKGQGNLNAFNVLFKLLLRLVR